MKKFNFKEFFSYQGNYCFLYVIFLFLYISWYFVQWPIFAGDTDLWYHLNGGRYIQEHGIVPKDSSFFSFITPPREWVAYYWFFQVVVYKIYSFSGYYGLIFLRTVIFLATIMIIYLILNRGIKKKPDLWTVLIFSLFMLMLLPRFHLIRPHMFTYFFIVLFILIIDLKPKYVILLPLIAVLWVNLHGIEYPVMLLIVLSCLVDFFIKRMRNKKRINKEELCYVIPLILSVAAVFCTPHGTELTWVPFIPTGFASLYINEIQHIKAEELLSFQIIKMTLAYGTVFNFLLFVSSIAAIAIILDRKNRRIGHLLMFAGGLVLLIKANRFRYECALLSLPLLKDFLAVFVKNLEFKQRIIRPVAIIITIFAMIIPVLTLKNSFINLPAYPFSHRNLPEGICTFLKKMSVNGGTVFNHPNHGGYIQWMLYPEYKIFMDMEIPFLFLNEDIFTANNAFSSDTGLANIIKKYHPSFIITPIGNTGFKRLIAKYPEYRVIFFDETGILYVDKKQIPEIADQYELKEIDPYNITNMNINSIFLEKKDEALLKELSVLVQIYSGCGFTNQLMAHIYLKRNDYSRSIFYTENIIKDYPENPTGYKLKGDALKGMGKYDEAISEYEKAIYRSVNKVEIYREIASIKMNQKKYKEAFKILMMITDPFSGTDYKSMYDVCLSAILSGNRRDAEILFKYALPLVPAEDREWNEKYNKLSEMIK